MRVRPISFSSKLRTPIATMDPIISSILEIEDILIRIFAAVIEVCPSAIGSTFLVNKKWHNNSRKKILWIKHPLLSHVAHNNTEELVSYIKIEEYVLELKILEHRLEIKRALRLKKEAELRRRALIQNRAKNTDIGELKDIMKKELANIKGLIPDQHDLIFGHSGWLKYDVMRQLLSLSYRQMAVMLVLCTFMPDVLPSVQFDKWTGVNHLFKTRQQLDEEIAVLGYDGQLKTKLTNSVSTIASQGLKRIKIHKEFDEEEKSSFKRLYDNSYLLGCCESYSSLNVSPSSHVFISASWLTFLSHERWIAMFLSFEADRQHEAKPLVVVKGSTTSPEIEIFDFGVRSKIFEEFSGDKANDAIRHLYEFSDEEWSIVPEPKYHHILSVLSGIKQDFLPLD